MDTTHRPCPRCGGRDRFYRIDRPRNGGAPYWRCRQCGYTEPDGTLPGIITDAITTEAPTIDPETRQAVYHCYSVVAQMSAERLWSPAGRQALAYLRRRGLRDETIRELRIGWSGSGDDLLADLWRRECGRFPVDRCRYIPDSLYDAALLGGLRLPGGANPRGVLRETIVFPYYRGDTCVWLRGRKLNPRPGEPRYVAPGGVPAFAGGPPVFYLHDLIHNCDTLLLTEGEIKCAIAHQEWRAGRSPYPCVATPGASFLPPALVEALRGKTINIIFDSDRNGSGQRLALKAAEKLRLAGAYVRIITLPLPPGRTKTDLDGFIVEENAYVSH